jgi:hypothetical protein
MAKVEHDLVVFVSPTEETNGAMKSCIPPAFIFREFDDKLLENLMETQRKGWSGGKKGLKVCLVLDDCAWDSSFFENKSFKKLVFNGRHLKITLILTLQYVNAIKPVIRSQVDVVATLNERQIQNRKKMHDAFFGCVSYPEFSQILDKTTSGYESLVLYNRSRSNDLSDILFWYKADFELSTNFKTSRPAFWKLSRYYGNECDASGGVQTECNTTKEQTPQVGTPIGAIARADSDGRTIIIGDDRCNERHSGNIKTGTVENEPDDDVDEKPVGGAPW